MKGKGGKMGGKGKPGLMLKGDMPAGKAGKSKHWGGKGK